MVKIMFVSYIANPEELLSAFKKYTLHNDLTWGLLKGTSSIDEADYLIVWDGLPRGQSIIKLFYNLFISKRITFRNFMAQLRSMQLLKKINKHRNLIYFQREPPDIKPLDVDLPNMQYHGIYERHYHLAFWRLHLNFRELLSLPVPSTFKIASVILTDKEITDGQKQRITVVRNLSGMVVSIDIFGIGLEKYGMGNSYKGELNQYGTSKFEGLYGYRYSLAFENSSHNNYFSEKLIDCFLCWTKPIYWGCPNISEYFPEESYAYVDIYSEDVYQQIIDEISKPVNYDAIKEARELVLYKYNLWPSIANVIDNISKPK